MNKKKYKVSVLLDYVLGHLRYGHLEGEIELTDEEVEMIKNGTMSLHEFDDELELVIDEYEVEDCGDIDLSSLYLEESKEYV